MDCSHACKLCILEPRHKYFSQRFESKEDVGGHSPRVSTRSPNTHTANTHMCLRKYIHLVIVLHDLCDLDRLSVF